MDGYELKIKLQRELGRDADVVPSLEAAAGRDRHNAALRLLLAREYKSAGRGGEAEAVYSSMLKESPTAEVYQGLFDLMKAERRGPEILRRLDAALKAASSDDEDKPGDATQAAHARAMLQVLKGDPDLVNNLLRLAAQSLRERPGLAYPTRRFLATLAARTRQLDVAESLYRSCLPEVGNFRRGGPREQEVYGGLLLVLRLAHKYQEMIDLCKEGLEKTRWTNRLLFHTMTAEAQMALGREKEALEAIDRAVQEAGEHDKLSCELERSQMLSQAGRHDDAVAACRRLLKEYNQPGDVRSIRSVLSSVYSAARDFAKSEEQLQRILEADPSDATANNDLGYLWADQNKNLDQAEKLVRKALDLDREQRKTGTAVGVDAEVENAAYVDSLGWVLFRKGRWAEARRELEKAAELPTGSDDPVVWDHLADVLHRLGEKDKAAGAWKKALTLYEAGHRRKGDGRYDEIKQKLRLLEP
jgi:tetratricopeptide (TPR) repeat protein